MIPKAAEELQVILEKHLQAHRLMAGKPIRAYGGPRRLVAECDAVLLRQPDRVREVTGPPKTVAFDNVGRPTKAAESFAAKQGVPVTKLAVVSTARGEYVCARQTIPGRAAGEILAEVLTEVIREVSFPRSMYWTGADGPRFIRPIRWIVALLGGQVVPFEFAGVRAGRNSSGHRFLGKDNVPVSGVRDFRRKLRFSFVLAHPAERQQKIERETRAALAGKALRVHADAELETLVTYLVEFPAVVLGDFDESFLDLPEEILVTVMRDHQKYFAVERRDGGLAPHFLAVMDLDRDRSGLVRAGHERVLRARFADARFFWQMDQKRPLADYLPRLAQVTYESKMGSYRDKVERVRWLARWLAEQWFSSGIHQADVPAADRAAELAKCDLVTEMVREFPELQGIVGGLYARAQGEDSEVAWAVYDHYRPVGFDDPIPRNVTGCILSLADKLDSLAGCFAVGLVPTGSSDPFALRRAALGIVKILLERALPLSLSASVAAARRALESHPPRIKVPQDVEKQVLDFLGERARFVFRERLGFAYDEINAVLAAGMDDLVDAAKRLEALKSIRRTKNFEPLAVAFKRIRNILEKSAAAENWRGTSVRPEIFAEAGERELHGAARQVAGRSAEHKRAGRYREALLEIAELRPKVDRFFDDVLVMAEDESVRRNRLALLAELLKEFSTIADFSELATESRG